MNRLTNSSFPECWVYIRSGRGVHYLNLRPMALLGIGFAFVTVFVAALYYGNFTTGPLHEAYEARIAAIYENAEYSESVMRDSYEARIAEMLDDQRLLEEALEVERARTDAASLRLAEREKSLTRLTDEFEDRIASIMDSQHLLEEALEVARARADEAGLNLAESRKNHAHTAGKLENSTLELSALREAYTKVNDERMSEFARVAELEGKLADLRLELTETSSAHENANGTMQIFSDTIRDVIEERDVVGRRAMELEERVGVLTAEVIRWENRQERMMTQLERATQTSIEGLEKVFKRANLNIGSIIEQTRRDYSGAGGPLIPISSGEDGIVDVVIPEQDKVDDRAASLIDHLEDINLMRMAIERLPFGRPLKNGRFTSGYGPRRDPFTGRRAMHAGIDWAGPVGTPVYATGDGTVSFVGRDGGYGLIIRIKHAFGFKTVYAHLNKAHVSVGQRVKRGERIASMGNTGRSTGSHLHYEVRAGKKATNPINFIRAVRDVL